MKGIPLSLWERAGVRGIGFGRQYFFDISLIPHRADNLGDPSRNRLHVFQYVLVGNAKNLQSMAFEKCRSPLIIFVSDIVCRAIYFDHQSSTTTIEIDDIRSNRMLTAKLDSGKTSVAEDAPKHAFCKG
jgi:hypothetical protein